MKRVKGFVQPELNEGQTSLLALFEEEHDETAEPERLDKIDVTGDDELRIYTSRFIDLDPTGPQLHTHLQIMTVYKMYDSSDPECDVEGYVRYREVLLTNVYRTFEGDNGWYTGEYREGKAVMQPDTSSLYTDWL